MPSTTLPPVIHGVPIVGVLPALLHRPLDRLLATRDRVGDIFTLKIGSAPWVVLLHPRHAEHVLVSQCSRYRKAGRAWESLAQLLGTGLAISEGELWRRQRRLIQPHFHHQQMAGLTALMIDSIAGTLDSWLGHADTGELFDLSAAYASLTLLAIARTLFGQGLSAGDAVQVGALVKYVSDHLPIGIIGRALPSWVPIPSARRYQQKLQALDAIVQNIIDRERALTSPSNSLLGRLAAEAAEGGMTDKQLRDEVMTFFLAGAESSSLALSWASHFLVEHPQEARKLQEEVDRVLGRRTPTLSDAAMLPYSKMVIQESLRLRPSNWWLPRSTAVDDEIDGYRIPTGTMIMLLIYGIHHHPAIWPEPEQFRPERFAPESVAQRHRYAFVPFGAGQRVCIGRELAILEGQLTLAMLLQRFSLEAAPGRCPSPQASMTLRPRGGLHVYLHRRS